MEKLIYLNILLLMLIVSLNNSEDIPVIFQLLSSVMMISGYTQLEEKINV